MIEKIIVEYNPDAPITMTKEEFSKYSITPKNYSIRDYEMEMDDYAELKNVVKDFFALLDATAETDEGREFHPVTISCSRALTIPKLDKVLFEMKRLAFK